MTRVLIKRAPIILLTVFVVGLFYLSTLITPAQVEAVTGRAGWFGPVLVALFILLTQVFAPLSGTPGIFVGIKLYGYANTLALHYAVSLLSAAINFWVARAYGRGIVRRLVGEEALKDIDELSRINERVLLITSRVFGYFFFDIISYAVGLTKIRFKRYFCYTAVLTLIPVTAQYLLFSRLDFGGLQGMLIYYLSMAATGAVFTKVFYKAYVRKKTPPPGGSGASVGRGYDVLFTLAKVFLVLAVVAERRGRKRAVEMTAKGERGDEPEYAAGGRGA